MVAPPPGFVTPSTAVSVDIVVRVTGVVTATAVGGIVTALDESVTDVDGVVVIPEEAKAVARTEVGSAGGAAADGRAVQIVITMSSSSSSLKTCCCGKRNETKRVERACACDRV